MADIEEVVSPLETLAAERLEHTGAPHTLPADGASIGELRRWAIDQDYHPRVAAGVAIGCAYVRRLQAVNDHENGQASTTGIIVAVARVSEWGAVLRLLEHGAAVEVDRLEEIFPDVLRAQSSRRGGGNGGKRPKRREWADMAAQHATRWEDFPEAESPLEFEDWRVYRDGERLVAVDQYSDRESSLARSTVEKRYLK